MRQESYPEYYIIPLIGDYSKYNNIILKYTTNKVYVITYWILMIGFLSSLLILGAQSYCAGLLDGFLLQFIIGVASILVLIPIHEALHASVLKLMGARNIKVKINFLTQTFFTSAHLYRMNYLQYMTFVLTPIFTISVLGIIFNFLVVDYQIAIISAMLIHGSVAFSDVKLAAHASGGYNFVQGRRMRDYSEVIFFYDERKGKTYFEI